VHERADLLQQRVRGHSLERSQLRSVRARVPLGPGMLQRDVHGLRPLPRGQLVLHRDVRQPRDRPAQLRSVRDGVRRRDQLRGRNVPIASPLMQLECFALSDSGPARSHNEDAFAFDADARLFAVFDGMGGLSSGAIAVDLAVRELRAFVDEQRPAPATHELLEHDARSLVARIHDAILRSLASTPYGYGTTAVLLSLSPHEVLVAHVGDSRAYRLRHRELEQLTTDHSLIEEVRRSGAFLDRVSTQDFEQRYANVVTRCLGYGNELAIDTRLEELCAGDTFLLCSDGLWRTLDERTITAILLDSTSAERACRALLQRALDAAPADNVTALVARVHR